MRTIVVLGAGELGSALARQLAARDVAARIVLVDESGQVAEGKALDIRQAGPVDRYSTVVEGTRDSSTVAAADVVIVADRAGAPFEWQGDQGVALIGQVAPLTRRVMILCAGARHLDVIERGVRELGIRRDRLLGSAPEALRSAVVSMTALEAGCAPSEISLTVVGRPPGEIIVPWEDASIGGRAATGVLSAPAIVRLDARLSKLWPPGPLTLASAAASMIAAAATASRRTMSAFVAVSREEGTAGRVAMLPVTLSPAGIQSVLTPNLSTRNRVRLETVLQR